MSFFFFWFVNVQTAEKMKSMAEGVADAAKDTLGISESEGDKGSKY